MTGNGKMACTTLIAALILSGCGGGDSGIASAPSPLPPAPAPTPSPTPTLDDTTVELLDHPASQELAVSTRDEPILIRYDATHDRYEVKFGSTGWSALADPPEANPSGPNDYFDIADQSGSQWFSIRAHYRSADASQRYRYSNLAVWSGDNKEWGNFVAFGTPTPASGVPRAGGASFDGFASGYADIPNDAWGAVESTPLEGTVRLDFDFAAGTLAGSLSLFSVCDCTRSVSTGELSFKDSVFARGSQTFGGSFNTGVAGINGFEGRFTGPGAEELIGSWAVPFRFEGASHQALGAWIAKREN